MTHYMIHFNQQWVGDHPEEWYDSRGPLARAVVAQMREAGVLVFAGGLIEEIDEAVGVDVVDDQPVFLDGPYAPGHEYVGGLTIVDVATEDEARMWAGKIAVACGWPQEMRRIKP